MALGRHFKTHFSILLHVFWFALKYPEPTSDSLLPRFFPSTSFMGSADQCYFYVYADAFSFLSSLLSCAFLHTLKLSRVHNLSLHEKIQWCEFEMQRCTILAIYYLAIFASISSLGLLLTLFYQQKLFLQARRIDGVWEYEEWAH